MYRNSLNDYVLRNFLNLEIKFGWYLVDDTSSFLSLCGNMAKSSFFFLVISFQVLKKWNIRPDNGTKNVFAVACARQQLEQSHLFLENKKSIALDAMKKNMLPDVSSAKR